MKQFITIYDNDNQSKLTNFFIDGEELIKQEQSSFLNNTKDKLPQDLITKINNIQTSNNDTFITHLSNNANELINHPIDPTYIRVQLDSRNTISVPANNLNFIKNKFISIGIDTVFSPFHILNNKIKLNNLYNQLNIFILNNILYSLIIDNDGDILYSQSIKLTTFAQISDDDFIQDDIQEQKLFNEIYYLEIKQFIETTLAKFYTHNDSVFIENINLFYTLLPIPNEQISQLQDEINIEIKLHNIILDIEIYLLTNKELSLKNLSFVTLREKKKSKNILVLFTILAASLIIGYFSISLTTSKLDTLDTNPDTAIKTKETKKINIAKLPNHIKKNKQIKQIINSSFDAIAYDAIIQEYTLMKTNSILVCKFLNSDSYIKNTQPSLLKLYKSSTVISQVEDGVVFKSIVENKSIIKLEEQLKQTNPRYTHGNFLDKHSVQNILNILLPQNKIIKFINEFKSDILTYNYKINIILKSPQEFYDFIEKLNRQSYSINISYPVKFTNINNTLEVSFNLQFHQEKKPIL